MVNIIADTAEIAESIPPFIGQLRVRSDAPSASLVTYKPLYTHVQEEIDSRLGFADNTKWEDKLNQALTGPHLSDQRYSAYDLATDGNIATIVTNYLPNQIRSGLRVSAEYPVSDKVVVEPGEGLVRGKLVDLKTETTIRIPFSDTIQTFYIVLFEDGVRVDQTVEYNDLMIAQIVVPEPGTTAQVRDKFDEDNPLDAYISMDMEYYLYGDLHGNFDEDTIELLRNNIGEILADNLIGNIRLSEDLKIINTQGSLSMDSRGIEINNPDGITLAKFNSGGVFFYNSGAIEISRFTGNDARVGNIKITQSSMQSDNFVPDLYGFRIQDDGNAEFNDVKLRGTLYAVTITENITVAEGVTFIGTTIFDGNLSINSGDKMVLDADAGADTYWKYNSSTGYLEGWVDGIKRIEL